MPVKPLETLSALIREARQKGNRNLENILTTLHGQIETAIGEASDIAKGKISELEERARIEADGVIQRARQEAQKLLQDARKQREDAVEREKTVHRGEYPLNELRSDTLVVHCSDPRFQEAFRLFAREELGLQNYDPLVIPGASQLLTFADFLPKFAQTLLRPLKFLVKNHDLKHLVIIMHEDCAWYKEFVPKFMLVKGSNKDQQIKDMLSANKMLQEEFPGLEIRMFYASITESKGVKFSEIQETR